MDPHLNIPDFNTSIRPSMQHSSKRSSIYPHSSRVSTQDDDNFIFVGDGHSYDDGTPKFTESTLELLKSSNEQVHEPLFRFQNSTAPDINNMTEQEKQQYLQQYHSKVTRQTTLDVQQFLDINHYKRLMSLFEKHHSIDRETFEEIFGSLLGTKFKSWDKVTMLFMKIDANSDGTIDWNEFSTYMISGSIGLESEFEESVYDNAAKVEIPISHKDPLKTIFYQSKERKYLTISREGVIGFWGTNFKQLKDNKLSDLGFHKAWVNDVIYLQSLNKLVVASDDRSLVIYDVASIKPRLMLSVSQFEHAPLCLAFAPDCIDDHDAILMGDDSGNIFILYLPSKFWADNSTELTPPEHLTPAKLVSRDSNRNRCWLIKRKLHADWVTGIQYNQDMGVFISTSLDQSKSMVIGEVDRKMSRHATVDKGITCFDISARPGFIVTGGRDKILRLWNPYVLNKAVGTLVGHNASICQVKVNSKEGVVVSISNDRTIKVWNARSMLCLQTIYDPSVRRIDDNINSMIVDSPNSRLIVVSDSIEYIPLLTQRVVSHTYSHDVPLVSAMFNESFHQIVSACQDGRICTWDIENGAKIFQFQDKAELQKSAEITAFCFDSSGRRLITAMREGILKIWNFNNGQMLKLMKKDNVSETSKVLFASAGSVKWIVCAGWDKKITIFKDDPEEDEAEPIKVIDTTGTSMHPGHTDDISALAFCPPNVIATGGNDGKIMVWNPEASLFKLILSEPLLEYRGKDEITIEHLLFIHREDEEIKNPKNVYLASSHGDGFVRLWDHYQGNMVQEVDVRVGGDEGMTCMSLVPDASLLIIGGSKGSVRVIEVKDRDGLKYLDKIVSSWMAHMTTVTSVSYAFTKKCILTSSIDCSIRLWTLGGQYIGTFGQTRIWNVEEPFTFSPLPVEIVRYYETVNKQMSKKKVPALLQFWQQLTKEDKNAVAAKKSAERATSAIERWKEFVLEKKIEKTQQIDGDLISIHNTTKHFSYEMTKKTRRSHEKINVQSENVYRFLECHELNETPNIVNTMKGNRQRANSNS